MLGTLIASVASGEIAASLERAKNAAVAYLLAAVAGFFGLSFLIVAAYIFTADRYGALQAAIGFGAGFLVVAIAVVVIHGACNRRELRRARRRHRSEGKALAATAAIALAPAILARARLPFLLPVLGLMGFAIYKENSRRTRRRD